MLVPLASALALFVVHRALTAVLSTSAAGTSRLLRFAAFWLATVLSGFVASLPIAVALVVPGFPPARAASILDPIGDQLSVSAYWGLLYGWLPALVTVLASRSAHGSPGWSARARIAVAAAVVVSLVLPGLAFGYGSRAAQLDAAAQAAIADGHTIGALPDPDMKVTPVPDTAEDAVEPGRELVHPSHGNTPHWRAGRGTGHRVLTISVMNFSAENCVLDGYPDTAFADENGSLLEVTVTHDESFMARDAGAAPVTIPPGGYAVTHLGWDAAPTAGENVVYRLYAAMYPGLQRGSWPITLDIVAGSEVAVTAWELVPADQPTPG